MNARLLALIPLLLVSPSLAAPPHFADIDALVKRHGIGPDTPGVAVLVLQNGKPIFEKCNGLARLKDKTPLTPGTTFELASVTKPFTALGILRLHDCGKLSMADRVHKYLSEMPQYRHDRPLLIRDLLQHTSGLPDYMKFDDFKTKDPKFSSNEDYIQQFAMQKEKFGLTFEPGEKYEYNNSNYLLLAAIIERVSKKSYGTFLREEIFKPLDMTGTWVYEKPGLTPKHPQLGFVNAISYRKDEKDGFKEDWASPPFRDEKLLTTGDGGIWTSLEDLAKWDAGMRNGKLLKAKTWESALKPSRTRDGKTNHYGYGWTLYFTKAGSLQGFGHNGAWGGFRTSYHHDRTTNRTIILLSNCGDFRVEPFRTALVKILDQKE